MRQLVLEAPHRLAWHDVADVVRESEQDAIVRPLAVALCDLDQPMILGQAPIAGPTPLGHECVAEVVEAGGGFAVGERVVVPFQISCGECDRCRRGLTGSCRSVSGTAMFGFGAIGGDWGGMLSDLVRVPYAEAMLVRVPDGVAAATVASVSDNVPDAWRAVAPHLAERPEAEVLVLGGAARSIGLYAVDVARALGAGRVVYVDDDPGRLAVAEALGAEVDDAPVDAHRGRFDVVVDATSSREGLHAALRATEPGGVCTPVGILFEAETPVPLFEMYVSGVRLHMSRAMARPSIPPILELVAAGRLHLDEITSARVPWDDAAEALLEPATKIVVER
jgi:alcohol dehydrogenase